MKGGSQEKNEDTEGDEKKMETEDNKNGMTNSTMTNDGATDDTCDETSSTRDISDG